MKKLHRYFSPESPEYVVLHGLYRESRGKIPSSPFRGIKNPQNALAAAKAELYTGSRFRLIKGTGMTFKVILKVIKTLGLRPLGKNELDYLITFTLTGGKIPSVEWVDGRWAVKYPWKPSEEWFDRPRFLSLPS